MQGSSAGHDIDLRRLPLPCLIDTESVTSGRTARDPPWLHCLPLPLAERCMAAVCQTTDATKNALLSLAAARLCSKVDDNKNSCSSCSLA